MGRKIDELEFEVDSLRAQLAYRKIDIDELQLQIQALDARCVALEKAVETVADLLGSMSRIQKRTLEIIEK